MNAISIQINRTKSVQIKNNHRPSSPTEIQKHISKEINKSFNENFPNAVKKIGYQRIDFNADLSGNSNMTSKAFLIHDNGGVQIFYNRNKIPLIGNRIATHLKQKLGGLAMSTNIPTFLLLFHKEIVTTFKEGVLFKIGFASVVGSLFAILGLTPEQFAKGISLLFSIAFLDALLGMMPNTKTEKDLPKDHTLNAKFLRFVTCSIAMVALYNVHLFTVEFIPNPDFLGFIPVNIHFFGAAFIIGAYIYSIFKYLAISLNAKNPLPEGITKFYRKDEEN